MKNNKGSVHQLVTRAAKAVWPEKRSMQRLGVLVFGLCALIGVTQAGNIQKMLLGSVGSTAVSQKQLTAKSAPTAPATSSTAAVDTNVADDTTVSGDTVASAAPNIVDLINDSETIIRGKVKEVTDGFQNGVPYTQVTVEVDETLRGQVGAEYTFRQFGLTQPRKMDNGKIYLGVTPDGWSRYEAGEDTMLFLHRPGSATGFQTTTGLGQGKVVFHGGNAVSQMGNEGLFENVEVNANLQNDKDKRLLATKKGAVNAEGFKSFVKRAVAGRWIEGGKMRHAKK